MHITAWLLSGALLASQAANAPSKRQFQVLVKDKAGAAINGAHVHVYRDVLFGNALEETFIADNGGTVHFAVVDGWYDICVMGGAFTPQCREIDAEGKNLSLVFTLTVSAAMEKTIGDRVY
jgi:hypothetical protein